MSEQDTGKMGEAELYKWTSQVGIVSNKCFEDKTGWDFLVEFPVHKFDPVERLDLSPPVMQCKIQVKAHAKGTEKEQIKLDNMMRLALDPIPAFILSIEYDEELEPAKAFLVHIDEKYISKTLKRLYEISNQEELEDEKLHKKTLDVRYNDEDLLPRLHGKGLEEALQRHLGDSFLDYSKQKLKLIEECGHEEGKYSISLNFDSEVNDAEALVDLTLGITDMLAPKQITIRKQRFGKVSRKGEEVLTEYGIKFTEPLRPDGQINAMLSVNGRSIDIPFDYFLPTWIKEAVEAKYLKIRLASGFLQLILGSLPGSTKFKYAIPEPSGKFPLRDFHHLALMLQALRRAYDSGSEAFLEVPNPGGEVRSYPLGSSELTPERIALAQTIEAAWLVAKHFDVQNSVEVSIEDLEANDFPLRELGAIVRPGGPKGVILEGLTDKKETDRAPLFGFLRVTSFQLGNYFFVMAYRLTGTGVLQQESENNNTYSVENLSLHIEQYRKSLSPIEFNREELINKMKDSTEEEDIIFIDDFDDSYAEAP